MEKIRLLLLAANPWKTERLGLDEEYQRIQDLWENSNSPDRFDLRHYPALRGEAVQEKVLKFKPHLIHFSGHGEHGSLVFADTSGDNPHEVSKQALARVFQLLIPDLKAVFLNACHSAQQADAIVEQVDHVVGMNAAIGDLAAIRFAEGFYTAIFNQDALNIEQAFDAGLNQMEIAGIALSEQQKPVLQKRAKSYVPTFQYDVFVSFADEDAQFADDLTDYLYKQLKQKLATPDGFQLCGNNDFNLLASSAILLVIASPAFCGQYSDRFEQFAKQQPVYLAEYKICDPRPAFSKGITPLKFWHYEDSEGMKSLTGDGYFARADELVSAIAKRLNELKARQQHKGILVQERENQKQQSTGQTIPVSVFLNSAPEDLVLTNKIKSLLKEKGVECVIVPMDRTKVSAADLALDSENKIIGSDAVLILYEQTTPVWASKQIMDCLRLQRRRGEPLKIIALHKAGNQPELGYDEKKVTIYHCPPQQVETYITSFIEALG